MKISDIMQKMIACSDGSLHDIDHFIKVWGYARTIGEAEGLDAGTQNILEIAAILHDIACPLCREKYGNTNGKYQEKEGIPLAEEFLRDCDLTEDEKERIVYLVGHHHTLTGVDGADYQILLEADYIVNAGESGCSAENLRSAYERLFRTTAGRDILRTIYNF